MDEDRFANDAGEHNIVYVDMEVSKKMPYANNRGVQLYFEVDGKNIIFARKEPQRNCPMLNSFPYKA